MYQNFSEKEKYTMSDNVLLRCHRRTLGVRCSNMVSVPRGTDPNTVNCGCHGKQKAQASVPQPQTQGAKTLPWEKKG